MTWPPVFGGVGALFVRCDNDPDIQAERIPGLTWVALKHGGDDWGPASEVDHWVSRMRARGLSVGVWVYCDGPPSADVTVGELTPWRHDFVIYDVETAYKSDEGGHYEYAAELVERHDSALPPLPAAVTSYGAYKTSIDFASFAKAGWPVFAQVYDAYKPGDENSYLQEGGGPYPLQGVHQLTRSLTLLPTQAVYRPEGIDG